MPPSLPVVDLNVVAAALAQEPPSQLHSVALGLVAAFKLHANASECLARMEATSPSALRLKQDIALAFALPPLAVKEIDKSARAFGDVHYPAGTAQRALASCVPGTVWVPYLASLDTNDLAVLFQAAVKFVHEDAFVPSVSAAHKDALALCGTLIQLPHFPLPISPHARVTLQRACVMLADAALLHALCRTRQATCLELWELMRRFKLPHRVRVQCLAVASSYLPLEDALRASADFHALVLAGLAHSGRTASKENKQALALLSRGFVDAPQPVAAQAHERPMRIFAQLYQLLDDAALHLILEPWKDFALLLRRPPPGAAWPFTAEHLNILLAKALGHESHTVRKLVLGRLLGEQYNFDATHLPHALSVVCGVLVSSLNSKDLHTHSMMQAAGVQLGLSEASVGASGGKAARRQRVQGERTEVDGFDLMRGLADYFSSLVAHDARFVPGLLTATVRLTTLNGALAGLNALSCAVARLELRADFGAMPSAELLSAALLHFTVAARQTRAEALALHAGYLALRLYPLPVALALLDRHLAPALLASRSDALVHGCNLGAHARKRLSAELAAIADDVGAPAGPRALAASWLPDATYTLSRVRDESASMEFIVAVLARRPDAVLPSPTGLSWAGYLSALPLLAHLPRCPHLRPVALSVLRLAVKERHLLAVAELAPHFNSDEIAPLRDHLLATPLIGPSDALRWSILARIKTPAVTRAAEAALRANQVDASAFAYALHCLDDDGAELALERCLEGAENVPGLLRAFIDRFFADGAVAPDRVLRALAPLIALSASGSSSEPLKLAVVKLLRVGGPLECAPASQELVDCVVALSRHVQRDQAGNAEWGSAQTVKCVTRLTIEPHQVHPAAAVRFACLAFLDRMLNASAGSGDGDAALLPRVALAVLRGVAESANDDAGRIRDLHDAQTLLVIAKCLARSSNDGAVAGKALSGLVRAVSKPGLVDEARFRLETVLALVAVRHWAAAVDALVPLLEDVEGAPLAAGSALVGLGVAWPRIQQSERAESARKLHAVLAPWAASSRSIVRVLALSLAGQTAKVIGALGCDACELAHGRVDKRTAKLLDKVRAEHARCDPETQTSLRTLLGTSVPTLLGEMCANDLLVDRLAELVREHMRDVFAGLEGQGAGGGVVGGEGDPPLEFAGDQGRFHQRKLDVDDMGDARQPLVVVASLVDKAPNLGGLARTCEVWRARTLVVGDLRVKSDAEFQAVSMSGEQWVPMLQVKPGAALEDYLARLKSEEGYVVVGLEQTLESVALHEFRWPSHGRVCLVLGSEVRGIPAELMGRLDATVEIPQLGMVRSLNVHVSAAAFMWEYTRNELHAG